MTTKAEWVLRNSESSSQWVPETDADREAVREHLKSVLAASFFNSSKRYPAFLRHVVEASLEGRSGILKERTLGIEVFHRDPTYDTSSDPIVRTAACEVRKRLGQYYNEFGQEQDIRIELPAGAYIPEFRRKTLEQSNVNSTSALHNQGPNVDTIRPSVRPPFNLGFGYLMVAITLAMAIIISAAGIKLHSRLPGTAMEEFWRPLLKSPEAVLVCIGELYTPQIDLKPNGLRNRFNLPIAWTGPPQSNAPYAVAALGDSIALANVAAWLRGQQKPYVIEDEATTTFSALGKGPAVLVGAFNNDWTIRLSDQLRYHFDMDPSTDEAWIVDRDRPSQKLALHIRGIAVAQGYEYSIVSRVYDSSTRHTVLALAGIAGGGTRVAVDFVTSRTDLEMLAKQAPPGWQDRNIQVLLGVSVVDGSIGPPRILSIYVW